MRILRISSLLLPFFLILCKSKKDHKPDSAHLNSDKGVIIAIPLDDSLHDFFKDKQIKEESFNNLDDIETFYLVNNPNAVKKLARKDLSLTTEAEEDSYLSQIIAISAAGVFAFALKKNLSPQKPQYTPTPEKNFYNQEKSEALLSKNKKVLTPEPVKIPHIEEKPIERPTITEQANPLEDEPPMEIDTDNSLTQLASPQQISIRLPSTEAARIIEPEKNKIYRLPADLLKQIEDLSSTPPVLRSIDESKKIQITKQWEKFEKIATITTETHGKNIRIKSLSYKAQNLRPGETAKEALLIFPETDHNGAFDFFKDDINTRRLLLDLSIQGYNIELMRVDSTEKASALLAQYTNKNISYLHLAGHGTPSSLEWSNNELGTLKAEDTFLTKLNSALSPTASITLFSCSTGRISSTKNLADIVAENAPGRRVFAPIKDTSIFEMSTSHDQQGVTVFDPTTKGGVRYLARSMADDLESRYIQRLAQEASFPQDEISRRYIFPEEKKFYVFDAEEGGFRKAKTLQEWFAACEANPELYPEKAKEIYRKIHSPFVDFPTYTQLEALFPDETSRLEISRLVERIELIPGIQKELTSFLADRTHQKFSFILSEEHIDPNLSYRSMNVQDQLMSIKNLPKTLEFMKAPLSLQKLKSLQIAKNLMIQIKDPAADKWPQVIRREKITPLVKKSPKNDIFFEPANIPILSLKTEQTNYRVNIDIANFKEKTIPQAAINSYVSEEAPSVGKCVLVPNEDGTTYSYGALARKQQVEEKFIETVLVWNNGAWVSKEFPTGSAKTAFPRYDLSAYPQLTNSMDLWATPPTQSTEGLVRMSSSADILEGTVILIKGAYVDGTTSIDRYGVIARNKKTGILTPMFYHPNKGYQEAASDSIIFAPPGL